MNTIIGLILAYLLGSIPTGLWIGQIFFKKNLREYGSGNTGTTNTFRILGKTAGTATFAIDFLKGTAATLLPFFLHIEGVSPLVFGLLAVIGHTFPILVGFILPAYDLFFTLIIIALALIIILRHKDNIQRIKQKKENLIPWGLNITHQNPEAKK